MASEKLIMEEVSRHRPRLARARRQRRCAAQRRSPGSSSPTLHSLWYQATSLWGAPAAVDKFCWMHCVLAEDTLHTMRCMCQGRHIRLECMRLCTGVPSARPAANVPSRGLGLQAELYAGPDPCSARARSRALPAASAGRGAHQRK